MSLRAAARAYAPSADRQVEMLVRDHTAMVRRIAWHVHGRVADTVEVEDLMQTGMIALVEAARAYEDRGHAFATYAMTRVRGAMIDALRKVAGQSRAAMARRRELSAARDSFERAHGRSPSDRELAEAMGVDGATLSQMQASAQSVRHNSLDDLYSDHSDWFADRRERADEAMDREALQADLARAIAALPLREAQVLQLYFVEELNLEEVGEVLGVGAARVCQLKKAALDKVRRTLAAAD